MLHSLLRAPIRHWGKGVTLWLLLVAAVVVTTALTPERFRSEGKLFVRLGRENAALDPTATIGHGSVIALPPNREQELNSVVELLQSRGLAEEVLDRLGVETFLDDPAKTEPPPQALAADDEPDSLAHSVWQKVSPLQSTPTRERALRNIDERLSVSLAKKSNIINVSFEHPSAHEAQRVLATLIDAYIEQHVHLHRTPGSQEFLNEQAEALRARLSTAENELQELKTAGHVASLDEQQKLLQTRFSSLEDQLFAAQSSLAVAQSRIAAIEKTQADLPASRVASKVEGHPNQAADLVRQQLYTLELREQELLSKYTTEHFLVKQLQQQIAEARAIAGKVQKDRTQVTTAANPAFDQLDIELNSARILHASLDAQVKAVESELAQARQEIGTLNDRAVKIARLERQIQAHDASYRQYLQSLEQTRLDQALEAQHMSNVAIAQEPTLELRAVRPRKLRNYALGLALATCAGLALTVLIELASSRVHTTQQLAEELEVAALVAIPHLRPAAVTASSRRPR